MGLQEILTTNPAVFFFHARINFSNFSWRKLLKIFFREVESGAAHLSTCTRHIPVYHNSAHRGLSTQQPSLTSCPRCIACRNSKFVDSSKLGCQWAWYNWPVLFTSFCREWHCTPPKNVLTPNFRVTPTSHRSTCSPLGPERAWCKLPLYRSLSHVYSQLSLSRALV